MKYWRSLLICVTVLLCLVLVAGKADAATYGNLTYTVSNGEVTITGLSTSFEGDLIIPDTIEGYPVTVIGREAFKDCTGLTSVKFPETLTVIGREAFEGCTGLTAVKFPETLTEIGWYSFMECTGLTSVTIPGSVKTIFCGAFRQCTGLTSVTILNGVEKIESDVFLDCTSLSTLKIPNSVVDIQSLAFMCCYSLTELDLPDNLKKIDDGTFWGCSSLTSLTIPAGVIHIGSEIWEWTFPAFGNCSALKEVKFLGPPPYICENEFANCTFTAYYPINCGWTEEDLTNYRGNITWVPYDPFIASGSCGENLTWTLDEKGTMTVYGTGEMTDYSGSGNSPYRDQIKSLVIENGVTGIGDYAFYGLSNLKTLTIPDSVTKVGVSAFEGTAWYDAQPDGPVYVGNVLYKYKGTCPESLSVSANTLGVSDQAFADCTALKNIKFFGNAPRFGTEAFKNVTATVTFDPDSTWTAEVMQNYGGNITWKVLERFSVSFARMVLGNALEFQFAVPKDGMEDWTDCYAIIEKSSADGKVTQKKVQLSQWESVTVSKKEYWAITYDGLAAKEMADMFSVTIYNPKGGAVSDTWNDSVRSYVSRTINGQNQKTKTMMVDMLNYGAAAQKQFNYNTGDLANSQLTQTQKAWATADVPQMENTLQKGDFYLGTRLKLENRIQMQMSFLGMNTSMYATYSYTDHWGVKHTETVQGKDFVYADGVYGVELGKLVCADVRQPVNVTVFNADGTYYAWATDSIESYICRFQASGELYSAMIKFADSTYAYLH